MKKRQDPSPDFWIILFLGVLIIVSIWLALSSGCSGLVDRDVERHPELEDHESIEDYKESKKSDTEG